MTISSTIRRAGPFAGNDVTTVFPFTFKVFTTADIYVAWNDGAGTESILVLDSDYSVSLNADQDVSPGGTVTYPLSGSPLATGESLAIAGDLEEAQGVELENGGAFHAVTHESAFDYLTILIQQLSEKLTRAFKVNITSGVGAELPAPEAGKGFGWNALGTAIINYTLQAGTSLVDLAASAGAALIGYLPGGTGAVATTVQSVLRETVSWSNYGITGSGDETAKIQAALTDASNNNKRIVDYTNKTLTYSSNLTCGGIVMEGNTVFQGTGSAYLDITGTLTEIGRITAAAVAGKNVVALSSVTGLSANDLLILQDYTANSFSPHRTEYYAGEFNKVLSVSGSNVTLVNDLVTSFAGAVTDKVYKSSGIFVRIDGMTFNGAGVHALRIQYANGARLNLKGCNSSGVESALILNKCYDTVITGGKYRVPFQNGVPGGYYGINWSNCQFGRAVDVDAYGGRHAVTTGGDDDDGSVPCRDILTIRSTLANDPLSLVYCADFHGNTTDSYFDDCRINGRVGLGGFNVGIIDCDVWSQPGSAYAPIAYHELVGGELLIRDCKAYVGNASTATAVVDNLGSSLVDDISEPYQIRIENLDATINSAVTKVVNAYESSGQANNWFLNKWGVRGDLSGMTAIIAYTKAGAGVDATQVEITDPQYTPAGGVTLLTLSGTTLASTIRRMPWVSGSTSDGFYRKFPDGTMVCYKDYSATDAISTAFLGGFRSGGQVWTYPAAFLAGTVPVVQITADDATCFSASISSADATSATFFVTAVSSQGSATISARVQAIGRYF